MANSDDQAKWHWEFLLHLENIFYNRTNFFLVAESMLLVSFVTSTTIKERDRVVVNVIALLGLVFTLAWWWINGFKGVRFLQKRATDAEGHNSSYKEIRMKEFFRNDNKRKSWLVLRILSSSTWVLGYWLPFVTLLGWIWLFCWALCLNNIPPILTYVLILTFISYLIYRARSIVEQRKRWYEELTQQSEG